MRLTLGSVFADAGTLWRTDSQLLVRLAGVLYFLPMLGLYLFLPEPPQVRELEQEAAAKAALAWYSAISGWLVLQTIFHAVASTAILTLLLDRRRPTAGAAIARAVGLLPAILIVWFVNTVLTTAGMILLILPYFYALGRTMLVLPVLAAESGGGIESVREGIGRTRGHGWLLGAAVGLPMAAGLITQSVVTSVEAALKASSLRPELLAVIDVVQALVAAATALAIVLLQASAYRLLGSRQGI